MDLAPVDKEVVKQFLQDTDVAIVLSSQSSQGELDNDLIVVPNHIPNNMIVAVQPPKSSSDKYWVACVTDTRSESPLTYNLRYYSYSKTKKRWSVMRGKNAYGTTRHEAILYAGIEFTNSGQMKTSCVKHLQHILAKNVCNVLHL